MLAMLLLGALATGALTVVATALRDRHGVQRAAAVLGSALVVFAVLLFGATLLLARPAPVRALWPGAVLGSGGGDGGAQRRGAAAGQAGGQGRTRLRQLRHRGGHVRLLYLVGQALVYAAEVAAVRYARLWPRALDLNRPTAADGRALALLAREQERILAARIEFHLAARDSPPEPRDSPAANDGPQ